MKGKTASRKPSGTRSAAKQPTGRKAAIPANLEPMAATLVAEPVEGNDWVYELKWDGYRAVAYLNKGTVHLASRNNKSFNEKFYPLYIALQEWGVNAVVDGEVVVLNEQGVPDFSALQQWRSEADGELVYYLFDLLWLEGHSVMELPMEERRERLRGIMPKERSVIRLSEYFRETGKDFFDLANRLGLEGIMAKRIGSTYRPGTRSKDWLKIKTEKHQELVIGGYTINEGTTKPFSALLLGLVENRKFNYLATVGTGFNRQQQLELIEMLKPFETTACQFSSVPDFNKPSRFRPNPPKADVVWVKPKIVVEISYRELTPNGSIRHPSYRGLRPDKKPTELVRELATPAEKIEKEHSLVKQKLISTPGKKERKTLLNPGEETQTRILNGHELRFTNLSKVFWPAEGYTKRDMINYYYQVAPYMLPYLKDRPQTMNRFPNGIDGKSFYQKDVKGKAPEWIETFPYYSNMDEREKEFLVCTNEASLLYLASLACIEIHPWHSRRQSPDNPDWCIIDLDPDKNTFDQVIKAAQVTKKVLDAIGVPSYPKTSGSTGLHIYIPFGAKYSYEDAKEFGRKLVKVVHAELPEFTSIERRTSDRGGKMYLDFLQNRPQATVAAPYSLRPKPGATVSMPLHWEEVKKGLKMKDFTIKNSVERLKREGDLFKPVIGKGINLAKALKAFAEKFE